MCGCILWSWNLGGHGAHAGPRPLLSPLCAAFSITSCEDRGSPHRQMSRPITPGPAHSPHTCQKPEGCWGPTELMGAVRPGAPARESPGHGGAVLGAAAGGSQTWCPRDASTCTFETPGFLLGPHSRRHACLRLSFLLIVASRFTPNPVLTCSVDSEKPGSARKDRGTGPDTCYQGDTRKPHQLLAALPLGLEPSAVGMRVALTLFIWCEISMVYFGILCCCWCCPDFFFPGCVIIYLTF